MCMESFSELRKAKELLLIAFKGKDRTVDRLKRCVYVLCFTVVVSINWNIDATFHASNVALPLKPKHFIANVKRDKKRNF